MTSEERLSKVRWTGGATYRVLSYYFSLQWNRTKIGRYLHRVLEDFSVPPDPGERRSPPTPGMPSAYRLVDFGPSTSGRYSLLYPEAPLITSDHVSDILEHLFWHVNSEAIRRTGDFLLVHAGAVVTPSGSGILLPGDSGAGKTTLVAGLLRAGFGYLSDEAGAIDPVTGRLYPYPKALTLKKHPADLFPGLPLNGQGGLVRGVWHVRADDIRPGATVGPSDVRFIVAPRYQVGASTELIPLGRAEGVAELARSTLNLSTYRSRALPLLARVVRGADCYRLVSGDVDGAVRALAQLTSSG